MMTLMQKPKSVAEWLGSQPKEIQEKRLAGLTPRQYRALLYDWNFWARPDQLAPPGYWQTWVILAGRGFGKTRSGAERIRQRVKRGARRIALVGATAADVRDVMVEGESGLLAICPKWDRPHYEPSKRRLTWPNGALATTYSADEPERLRGPQHDDAWCDELGSWRYVDAWSNLMFGLRLGTNPQVVVTTTPRPVPLLKELLAEKTTVKTGGSTYDNRANLAKAFFDRTVAKYEGTRLGLQELHAEMLEISEGAWFPNFSMAKHVPSGDIAKWNPNLPVFLAIDCGVSRCTGAVFFQVQDIGNYRHRVTVFADYYAEDLYSEANAIAIRDKANDVCQGRIDKVRLDPASTAKTGVGPAARAEYEKVFNRGNRRIVEFWPTHRVADGLDQIEVLMERPGGESDILIHHSCTSLIDAFKNYQRAEGQNGAWLTWPKDPQHPAEDMMDALRGGLRDAFPEGRKEPASFRRVAARNVF